MDKTLRKIAKKNILRAITQKACLHLQNRYLTRDYPIFMESYETNEVFIYDREFDYIVEVLQPVVHYDPKHYDDGSLHAYFYLPIAGEQWKIFTILD